MLFPLYGRREAVRLALGFHPLDVAQVDLAKELNLFKSYVAHTSYVGEVGLDFSAEGRSSRALQEEALSSMLSIEGVADKIVSVHSRGASKETIGHLVTAHAQRVIMHWFSGPLRDAEAALDAGFYFSINPRMIHTKKGRAIIDLVPRGRALLESDGPYVRIGNRVAEPSDVLRVAGYLSQKWEMPLDDVLVTLAGNLGELSHGLAELSR
jgi:TatD DNase family protein